jgi:hypothetical protein
MNMTKQLFCMAAFLVCVGAFAQDSGYYKAIQKGAATQVPPKQFKQMEQDALKNYSRPETYEALATTFANTTERIWGVVYGEAFCNLSSDPERSKQIGTLAFELYAKSLSTKGGGNLSVNLTENAEVSGKQPPFESQFEMAFLMGAVPFGADTSPLSIKKLANIRKNQLSLWKQKNLPETALIRRQQAILATGHFDAYNYWLFQGARPDEFSEWLKEHQPEFQSWKDWQDKNKFTVERPDFQRLYLLKQ